MNKQFFECVELVSMCDPAWIAHTTHLNGTATNSIQQPYNWTVSGINLSLNIFLNWIFCPAMSYSRTLARHNVNFYSSVYFFWNLHVLQWDSTLWNIGAICAKSYGQGQTNVWTEK